MEAFSIVLDGRRILARGDLGSWDAPCLESFFSTLAPGAYVVEAGLLTIVPEAVTAWITAVIRNVGHEHQLDYAPSQLASSLELDDRYDHPASFFVEAFDPLREPRFLGVERLGFVG